MKEVIAYKVMIVGKGVMTHHDLGIADTPINELFKPHPEQPYGLHPDLVEAAITSVKSMADAYNGANHEEQERTNEGQSEQAASQPEIGTEDQVGNADEEAGQVKEEG